MKTAKYLAIVLLFACLTGCAELNVKSGYQLSEGSGKGILAVGITADESMPNFYWHLRKVGSKDSKEITFHTVYDPLVWTNPKGRLVVIELDEGEYEFYDWEILLGFQPTAFFKIPFSIIKGRISYKGRIDLKLNRASQNYSVDVSDHLLEDYEMLKRNIENINDRIIDAELAVFLKCTEEDCIKTTQEFRSTTITVPIILNK
ncbi:hypothetical protein [Nevskia sp.]|uniref:hypothetical protein n=1 Tax=Nevskia sp. TaxID=1929292 RepID=UPI0025DF2C14|nr:hypothetical protein [Nevskia sp.]